MNAYRVAGIALMAGLALFLLSVLVKLLLIAGVTILLARIAGGYVMRRAYGQLNRGGWQSAGIVSIDNPAYRSPRYRAGYDRRSDALVIPIR